MFVIDKIEGNSKIGVPVFSSIGRKSNFKYQVFQENYEEKKEMLMRNRQESQEQSYLRRYKEISEHFSKEKGKIHDRLQQIEQALQKQKQSQSQQQVNQHQRRQSKLQNTTFINDQNNQTQNPNNQDEKTYSNNNDSKKNNKKLNGRSQTSHHIARNSCQFKSISRDQYYQVHYPTFFNTYKEQNYMSSHLQPPPPLGHYNPKYSSIDKCDKSGIFQIVMNENRDNENAAKQLKEDQFLKKFQVCDKLKRAIQRNKQYVHMNKPGERNGIGYNKDNQLLQQQLQEDLDINRGMKAQTALDLNQTDELLSQNEEDDGTRKENLKFSKQQTRNQSPNQRSPQRQLSPTTKKHESSKKIDEPAFYRLNLNSTPNQTQLHYRNQSTMEIHQQVSSCQTGYYQEIARSNTTHMRRNRKLAQSIDQNTQLLKPLAQTFYAYGEANISNLNTGTRLGSALTNGTTTRTRQINNLNQQSKRGGLALSSYENLNHTGAASSSVGDIQQLDTFRPIEETGRGLGIGSGLINNQEIVEEFSIHDITYRTNKVITNREFHDLNQKNTASNLQQNQDQYTHLYKTSYNDQNKNNQNTVNNSDQTQVRQNRNKSELLSQNTLLQKQQRVKSFDMSKNLPRYIEDMDNKSRKRPLQKATDNPKTLVYYPRYESVLRREDKGIVSFTKIVSREDQPRSIYDQLKPAYNNVLTNTTQNIDECYDKLGHVQKNKPPNFDKSKKRDLTYIMKNTEAYNNILRDNEKWEYRNMFRLKKSQMIHNKTTTYSNCSKDNKDLKQQNK